MTSQLDALDLRPIRCSRCGRFLGEEKVEVGVLRLKCKNCKMWTTVLGESGWSLTEQDEDAMVEE